MPSESAKWPIRRAGVGVPPLLFIHGLLGCKEDWSEVIDDLAEEHCCLAVDLPGHGENIRDPIPDYDQLIKSLDHQRVAAGVDQCHMVGYSLGGRIALQYAVMYPARVASLTLVSASPGIRDEEARMERKKTDRIWAEMMRELPAQEFLTAWYLQPVFESLHTQPELLNQIIQRRSSVHLKFVHSALEKWGQGTVPSLWDQLGELAIPVQVLVGQNDELYCAHAERMKSLFPDIHVTMVESAGHALHLEQPDKLSKRIEHFINAGK